MTSKKIADLKREYPIYFRVGIAGALFVHILLFTILPKEIKVTPYKPRKKVELIAENIPSELKEIVEPPPEQKPALPVAAESEAEVEAATIGATDFAEIYKKPEESVEIPVVPFWKVEVPPKPIHPVEPVYPELARKAEIEGKVVVKVLVDIDGKVIDAVIIKSSKNAELDRAALKAARQWIFSPAKQRDRYVRVWVVIPFDFKLTD